MPRVLIADDSRFQVQMLTSWLTPRGFEILAAYDAMQAWTAALRLSPDAILLDINMPAGTGLEVLKRMRLSAKTQNIPVIVITGESNPGCEATFEALGISKFLQKPVEEEELCAALDRVLQANTH